MEINAIIRARYIGPDHVDIRNGEIYEVFEVKDDNRFLSVKDRSGEFYAYPKHLFKPEGSFVGSPQCHKEDTSSTAGGLKCKRSSDCS